jgi:hypothetical protein
MRCVKKAALTAVAAGWGHFGDSDRTAVRQQNVDRPRADVGKDRRTERICDFGTRPGLTKSLIRSTPATVWTWHVRLITC